MITIDTSALVALFNAADSNHERVLQAFKDDGGPYLLPALVMAEVAYVVDARLGSASVLRLLDSILTGRLLLDCNDDLGRTRELIVQYDDFPLGFADAAVVACAERHGGNVLTLDYRHFGVVAGGASITIYP